MDATEVAQESEVDEEVVEDAVDHFENKDGRASLTQEAVAGLDSIAFTSAAAAPGTPSSSPTIIPDTFAPTLSAELVQAAHGLRDADAGSCYGGESGYGGDVDMDESRSLSKADKARLRSELIDYGPGYVSCLQDCGRAVRLSLSAITARTEASKVSREDRADPVDENYDDDVPDYGEEGGNESPEETVNMSAHVSDPVLGSESHLVLPTISAHYVEALLDSVKYIEVSPGNIVDLLCKSVPNFSEDWVSVFIPRVVTPRDVYDAFIEASCEYAKGDSDNDGTIGEYGYGAPPTRVPRRKPYVYRRDKQIDAVSKYRRFMRPYLSQHDDFGFEAAYVTDSDEDEGPPGRPRFHKQLTFWPKPDSVIYPISGYDVSGAFKEIEAGLMENLKFHNYGITEAETKVNVEYLAILKIDTEVYRDAQAQDEEAMRVALQKAVDLDRGKTVWGEYLKRASSKHALDAVGHLCLPCFSRPQSVTDSRSINCQTCYQDLLEPFTPPVDDAHAYEYI